MTIIALVLTQGFGIDFSADEQADTTEKILGMVAAANAFVGPIMVIWGRFTATAAIRIIALLLTSALLPLGGCAGSIPGHWVDQNQDFTESVVHPLLSHYNADPAIDAASKANMNAGVAEHETALADWETQLPSGFMGIFGGGQ